MFGVQSQYTWLTKNRIEKLPRARCAHADEQRPAVNVGDVHAVNETPGSTPEMAPRLSGALMADKTAAGRPLRY